MSEMEANNIDIRSGENYFQWISRSTKIVNKENEQIPFDVLNDKTFLGIYFAANWIPVSKNYLHIIDNVVNAMEARDGCSMGMLLASCDQNEKDMIEFVTITNIAYPVIPPDSKLIESLKEKFEVEEIPILVVLNLEKNSVVDKVDKLKLESLLEKEDPEALCNVWLGISDPNDMVASSPYSDRKFHGKEKKQQAKAEKDRLKTEKKKQEKVERVEQKKISRLGKQRSKEFKKLKRKGLNSVQDDTASAHSERDDGDQVASPESHADVDITADSPSIVYNTLREANGNLSDGSEGSIDAVSGKRKKKKRTMWGRTETPKHKETDSQVFTLLQRNNELEHLIIELEKNKQEQETENSELHARVDSLNGTIADKDEALKELEERNKEVSRQLCISSEENTALKQDKERLSQELNGVKEDHNQTKEELRIARDQMEEIEQEKQVRETDHQKFLETNELNGWMHKRGRKSLTRGLWQNRFFRVGDGFKLHYYKSPKMKSPRGFINLGDVVKVEPVKDKKYNLITISTNSNSLELRAPDETTRDNWINSINFLTHYCKKYHSKNETDCDVPLITEGSVDETGNGENKDESDITPKPLESIEISPVTVN